MCTLGTYVSMTRQFACEVLRARTYFSRACLGEVVEVNNVLPSEKKKEKDASGNQDATKPCAHYSCNSTICGVFWTAACLRMPALNTRQGRRDRDGFLHFVLLRPHDITSDGHVAVPGRLPSCMDMLLCSVSRRDDTRASCRLHRYRYWYPDPIAGGFA